MYPSDHACMHTPYVHSSVTHSVFHDHASSYLKLEKDGYGVVVMSAADAINLLALAA